MLEIARGGTNGPAAHGVFHGSAVDTAGHIGLYASFFDSPGYRLIHRGMEVQRGHQNDARPDTLDRQVRSREDSPPLCLLWP